MSEKHSSLTRRRFIQVTGALGAAVFQTAPTGGQPASNPPASSSPQEKQLSRIKVAQVKVYPEKGNLSENHQRLLAVLAKIEKAGPVDVVVTPEGFLDGYVSTEKHVAKKDMIKYAIDPVNSEYTRAVSRWARRRQSWVVFGCSRRADDGIYNTALIYNRRGDLIDMYDKLHLQTHDYKYTHGRHLNVYDSEFGRFGVMICADRRWPETTRTLTLKGARIIFNPTYGMHGDLNLCMMRTRAYENGIYIIFTHPGQSLITGPRGNVVVKNDDDKQTYTITEIDLSRAKADQSGHIRDRRPDVYQL